MPIAQDTLRNHLVNEDTFGTTLLVIVIDRYGTEALSWAPQTIRLEIEEDFGIRLPDAVFNRLMAAISVVTSDDFYKRLPIFVYLCNSLAGADTDPDEFDPADSKECAWGMTEAMLLSPPDQDDPEPYTDEIRYYLGHILDKEGIREPPDLLRMAIQDTPDGQADYSGLDATDPVMFAAGFEQAADKSAEIKTMLEETLADLFQQLSVLPVKNGNTQDLLKRVQGNLAG